MLLGAWEPGVDQTLGCLTCALRAQGRSARAEFTDLADTVQGLLEAINDFQHLAQKKLPVQVELAEETEAHSIEARVQTYLLESFASGTEGLMLKSLDKAATYQASKRSENWIKLKR